MAGASLLALLDDIATILDDVSVLTKVAAKKTAGVLGDDLALNAQQVAGVRAERELPVVWAVARGSLLNKLILVPAALAISAFLPWAVLPLLMIGGAFLCYEGAEKLAHRFLHREDDEARHHQALRQALDTSEAELKTLERDKIRGAIRTDFILSAEIIAITLAAVSSADFDVRVGVLATVALLMTVGVYGLVAAIVKLDDVGLHLVRRGSALAQTLGRGVLATAPRLMKFLSVAGTAAMFLVGGGIVAHGIAPLHHAVEARVQSATPEGALGGLWSLLASMMANLLVGLVVGAVVLGAVTLLRRWRGAGSAAAAPGGAHRP